MFMKNERSPPEFDPVGIISRQAGIVTDSGLCVSERSKNNDNTGIDRE